MKEIVWFYFNDFDYLEKLILILSLKLKLNLILTDSNH